MTHLRILPDWHLPDRLTTPESLFLDRRTVLKGLGLGALTPALLATQGAAPAFGAPASAPLGPPPKTVEDTLKDLKTLSVKRNPAYTVERPPTREILPAQFNNFYEFSLDKDDVWELAHAFKPQPWTLQVTGMVAKPRTFDLDDLLKRMPLEERVYRFRCVEAWSMVVPWVGFPLSA
ncbi:MAG: molybdopterin-dependent oxidoreductase, partial [Deltaproteobacteria bacterium]|nr:molybdopterin-dependent oxidoreductase [Deltaproteobacteria bacterium]